VCIVQFIILVQKSTLCIFYHRIVSTQVWWKYLQSPWHVSYILISVKPLVDLWIVLNYRNTRNVFLFRLKFLSKTDYGTTRGDSSLPHNHTNQSIACTLIHVFMRYILTIPSICYIPSTINTSSNAIKYFYINYFIILNIENINSIPIEYINWVYFICLQSCYLKKK
jgi:hypothetical protein